MDHKEAIAILSLKYVVSACIAFAPCQDSTTCIVLGMDQASAWTK